jgi:hypothetical protein
MRPFVTLIESSDKFRAIETAVGRELRVCGQLAGQNTCGGK